MVHHVDNLSVNISYVHHEAVSIIDRAMQKDRFCDCVECVTCETRSEPESRYLRRSQSHRRLLCCTLPSSSSSSSLIDDNRAMVSRLLILAVVLSALASAQSSPSSPLSDL